MDELDTLQMELETLLNAVVIRSQNLQREIAGMTEKPSSPGKRGKDDRNSPKKQKLEHGKSREAHTPPLLKQIKIKSTPVNYLIINLIQYINYIFNRNLLHPEKFF